MRVLIIGAGGHGQVVADILLRQHDAGYPVWPAGFVDDDARLAGKTFLDIPVVATLAGIGSVAHDAVVVAIGVNAARARVSRELAAGGENFFSAIHPRATLAPDVVLGPGCMICAGAVVNTGTLIGRGVILNTGCTVDHHNAIADFAHIAPGAHLGGTVTVGEETLVGIGATVLPNRAIGARAVVGAGAVVVQPVPENTVVVGNPAKVTSDRPRMDD